ncbi:unnamed protein product [Durusdinium trenchii]|uniref:Uncharacterized protein n=1 Tax=Durusdinium trenchii TaxID=1381693 RepID=A0ABP0SJW6_9DINO
MPTPTAASRDLQREFSLLRQELQADLQRLTARLDKLENRFDGRLQLPTANLATAHSSDASPRSGDSPSENEMKIDVQNTDLSMVQLSMVVNNGFPPSQPEIEEPQDEQDGLVPFEESAWSFPLVVGLAPAGPCDVTFAIILLLLNLGMQVAFSVIILDENFIGSPFTDHIDNARRWRTSIAHDYTHMDLAKTSLVSRVCSEDGALILSTPQANLIQQINSFLSLGLDQFQPGFFQVGSLLSMLCILLWSLCVYKEYRSIWLTSEAVWRIPRSKCTLFRDNEFHTISTGRLKILLFTYVARAAIASLLLGAGIRWLAQTTSISELMLNAVSLNAILDVDEFLFAGFTPISIQLAVRTLEPLKMKYSRRRSQLETWSLFVLLVGTITLPYFVLLNPLGEQMVQVKHELCAGNQTFVVGRSTETQMTVGLVTRHPQEASELTVTELAVEEHKFNGPNEVPYLINFMETDVHFYEALGRDMAAEVKNWGLCIEKEVLMLGVFFYQDPLITPYSDLMLRQAATSLGTADVSRGCAGLKHLCNDPNARLLRMVCGHTCGCTDPLASAWHKVTAQGCIAACSQIAFDAAAATCQDNIDSENWEVFWNSYPDVMTAFWGNNVTESAVYPVMLSVADAMKSSGCSALMDPQWQAEPGVNHRWCEGYPPLWRPLAWQCPESCGCKDITPLPAYCPSRCAATSNETR